MFHVNNIDVTETQPFNCHVDSSLQSIGILKHCPKVESSIIVQLCRPFYTVNEMRLLSLIYLTYILDLYIPDFPGIFHWHEHIYQGNKQSISLTSIFISRDMVGLMKRNAAITALMDSIKQKV